MLRRTFLAAGSCGLAVPALAPAAGGAAAAVPEIIDTHTHFYRTPWPETMPQKQRDALFTRPCSPADLIPAAREKGVTGTVVVESSPDLEDNQWLLDLAAKEPFILGVVGRIDPAADGFEEHVERFAANPLFRGIRIYQGEIEAGLKPDAALLPRCRLLAERGLVLDVVGDPAVIGLATRLAAELPALTIVIDHVGNARIDGQPPKPALRETIEAAARQPNVRCKVSAIVENVAATPAPRDVAYYSPLLDLLWTAFGQDRLLFGSNWPIWTRKNSFAGVLQPVRDYFSAKGDAVAGKFFQGNARTTYGLSRVAP